MNRTFGQTPARTDLSGLFNRALHAHHAGQLDNAATLYRQILSLNKTQFDTLHMLGVLEGQRGNPVEGARLIAKAIKANPKSADAHLNLGRLQGELEEFADAERNLRRAIAIGPETALAYCNLSAVLDRLKRPAEALAAAERALALVPGDFRAQFNCANSLYSLNRFEEAAELYRQILAADASNADGWLRLGKTLAQLNDTAGAMDAFERTAKLNPNMVGLWLAHGRLLNYLFRHDDAIAALDRELVNQPASAAAWLLRGEILHSIKRYEEAIASYDEALRIDTKLINAVGLRAWSKMSIFEWNGLDADLAALLKRVRKPELVTDPISAARLNTSNEEQLRFNRQYVKAGLRGIESLPAPAILKATDRIKVAYVSSDFGNHPVAQLLVGVLEHHDRAKFEIVAWSTMRHAVPLYERIAKSVEHFIDGSTIHDAKATATLRDMNLQIAVDLNGHTRENHTSIFARRAAPLQVNYLGYPGTSGADFMDYMIADRTVIPESEEKFYSESVALMPDSFMPADSRRDIAPIPTRGDAGLPEGRFVFCDFNDPYKITPALFDVWMSLLRQVEGSVLWLRRAPQIGMDNLRREAEQRGVNGERLVFAKTVDANADHVARIALADLFLDSLPYNAHATANEALWAGLPLVTCLGNAFAGRVAASQLRAVGLPELVTTSWLEYEALALKLAHDPALLAAIRAKLAAQRNTSALFDTARYTRNLETAYSTMWERALRGEAPATFAVKAES